MALLELNLEKPALVEEYRYPSESPERVESVGERASSGRGAGGLVGLLVAAVGVGLLAWKLRGRGSGADVESGTDRSGGAEPEAGGEESGGSMRRVAGLVGFAATLAGAAALARRRRR